MSHQHTNHLIHETSPYLLQHAHNPVNWYPWGAEAIQKARTENKPIFLSIGYSTCYWCHVMERQSFEAEEVAQMLNEHFVSIKVDREERPEIDDIYMQATLIFTQGHGGWPMSVFLTPDLKPFHAGTYFPRAQFLLLLQQVADVWRTHRDRIEQTARLVAEAIAGQTALSSPSSEGLDERLLNFGVQILMEAFDGRYGGFGGAPKFPPSQALRFLWQRYRQTRDDAARQMVVLTLEQMARGGIYDQIGGGFARYATDPRWLVPHFEKMLYDNAQLAPLYAEAFALTKGTYFRRIAEETYNFVLREMTDPQGGFYSALDAESDVAQGSHEKEEGAYYLWTPEEVKEVLGEPDGEAVCQIYDITPGGNFEGKNIPNLLNRSVEEWAKQLNTEADSLWQWLDEKRRELLEARQRRPYPHRDDKILTSWNALMIDAFARGYAVLKNERYREAAENAARFILTQLRDSDGRLRRTYRDGQAKLNAYLDDYAFLVVALVELHKATTSNVARASSRPCRQDVGATQTEWLKEAEAIADQMIELFWDESAGGFFFTSHDHPEQLIAPLKSGFDGAEPSGNGMAALGLFELGRLTGRADLLTKSRQTIEAFGGFLPRAPRGFGTMLYVLARTLSVGAGVPASPSVAISPDEIIRLEVSPDAVTLHPGETASVSVHLNIKEGWHIQSSQPTLGFLTPTELKVSARSPSRLGLPVQVKQIHYPPGQPLKLAFAEEELDAYAGDVTLTVELLADADAPPQTGALDLMLSYQACDATRCLRAAQVQMSVSVTVV